LLSKKWAPCKCLYGDVHALERHEASDVEKLDGWILYAFAGALRPGRIYANLRTIDDAAVIPGGSVAM
jgi:hypothetical protein